MLVLLAGHQSQGGTTQRYWSSKPWSNLCPRFKHSLGSPDKILKNGPQSSPGNVYGSFQSVHASGWEVRPVSKISDSELSSIHLTL